LMALVEIRYRSFLRDVYGEKLEDVHSLFKETRCMLAFEALDSAQPVVFERDMNLNGDTSDFAPLPILYLKREPSNPMLIDAFELNALECPNGGYLFEPKGSLVFRAGFLSAIIVSLASLCVVFFYWIFW
ncbi:MAG: hypothetical protein ACKO3V_09605, partial [Pirellula sp.]